MERDGRRLPDFLIIGAAKAGTTTLYRDLQTNPRIFFPVHKEPSCLAHDRVLTEAGVDEYAYLFREAGADQWLAEASTVYTKRPRVAGVPERAMKVLGADLRVIYVVREPVARSRSLHSHMYNDGVFPRAFDDAVHCDHRLAGDLLANSRYATQIQPWIDTFGRDHVHIICFEHYVQQRVETINAVCAFLGIPPRPDRMDPESKFNVTADRRYGRGPLGGVIKRFTQRRAYRFYLRRLLPDRLVETGKRMLFRPPRAPAIGPSPEMLDRMIAEFEPEADRLRRIMGLSDPLWDFEAVREKHAAESASARSR